MKQSTTKQDKSQGTKCLLSVQNKTTKMWFIDQLSYDSFEQCLADVKSLMKVLYPDQYVYLISTYGGKKA